MIKVFFLLFEPGATWDGIARARRGFSFILFVYLLPMIVISSAVEGWGLDRWGKWQPKFQQLKTFSNHGIVTFEAIQAALLLLMVLVSALLLLKMSQTFEHRRNYQQAFTTMAYGYSPLFLAPEAFHYPGLFLPQSRDRPGVARAASIGGRNLLAPPLRLLQPEAS